MTVADYAATGTIIVLAVLLLVQAWTLTRSARLLRKLAADNRHLTLLLNRADPSGTVRSGQYFRDEIVRAGTDMGRTPEEIQAALCGAYTEVAALPPEQWNPRRGGGYPAPPDGFVDGPFLRRGGSPDVYAEALWFYGKIDALPAGDASRSPGAVAWRALDRRTEEYAYLRHEALAAQMYAPAG